LDAIPSAIGPCRLTLPSEIPPRLNSLATCEGKHGATYGAANQESKMVALVKTDSTHPPAGLLKNPPTIARSLASRRVSPKGPPSGLRMLNYFVNRGPQPVALAPLRTGESKVPAFETDPRPELWKHPQDARVPKDVKNRGVSNVACHPITLVAFAIRWSRPAK